MLNKFYLFVIVILCMLLVSAEDIDSVKEVYILGNNISFSFVSEMNISVSFGTQHFSGIENLIDTIQTKSLEPGVYLFNLTFFNENYSSSQTKNISIIDFEIGLSEEEIEVGESFEIDVKIDSAKKVSFLLDYGDGNQNFMQDISGYDNTLSKDYEEEGTYKINGTIMYEENRVSIIKEVKVVKSVPESTIKLISPLNNAKISKDEQSFEFNVSGDIKNCTFTLQKKNQSGYYTVYEDDQKNIHGEKSFLVEGVNVSSGEYKWVVSCLDESEDTLSEKRTFEVQIEEEFFLLTSNKEEDQLKNKVSLVIDKINVFLKKEMNSDEKEVVEKMDLFKKLNLDKKRLLQIEQDMTSSSFNSQKEQLEKELLEIEKRIPTDLEVIEKVEFMKNSNSEDFEKIIFDYLEVSDIKMGRSEAKKLASENLKLQEGLEIVTEVFSVKVSYSKDFEEFLLIVKETNKNKASFDNFVEYIPEKYSDKAVFFTEGKKILNFFSFEASSEELIYSVEGNINDDEIKNIETFRFKESYDKSNAILGITGFSIVENIAGINYYGIILFFVLIFLAGFVVFKKKSIKIEKEDLETKDNFSRIKDYLKKGDLDSVYREYKDLSTIYQSSEIKSKKKIIRELKLIYPLIQKEIVLRLIEEYNRTSDEKKQESLNKRINKIYKTIPLKYRVEIKKFLGR